MQSENGLFDVLRQLLAAIQRASCWIIAPA
jgi:hypothetical protein